MNFDFSKQYASKSQVKQPNVTAPISERASHVFEKRGLTMTADQQFRVNTGLFNVASQEKYGSGHRLSLHQQLNNSVSKLEEKGRPDRLNYKGVQRNLLAKTGSLPGVNGHDNNSVERVVRSTADKNIVISDLGGSIETPNRAILLATRGS